MQAEEAAEKKAYLAVQAQAAAAKKQAQLLADKAKAEAAGKDRPHARMQLRRE